MGLVTCPDCSRRISDAAPRCIGCGWPNAAALPAAGAAASIKKSDLAAIPHPGLEEVRQRESIPTVRSAPAFPYSSEGFALPDEAAQAAEGAAGVKGVRPWDRFFARYIDSSIAVIVAAIVLLLLGHSADDLSFNIKAGFFGLLLWIPVEAAFLSAVGKTLGKALLSTSVTRRDGQLLSYKDALTRSASVWLYGLGAGIPLFSLFTFWLGYRRLTATGETAWDEILETTVRHQPLGVVRAVIAACIILAMIALSVIG